MSKFIFKIINLLLIIFLLKSNVTYARSRFYEIPNFKTGKSIFDDSFEKLDSKNPKIYLSALEKIDQLKMEVLKSKNVNSLIYYYFNYAIICNIRKDNNGAKNYIKYINKLVTKYKIKDPKILGIYYEMKYVLSYYFDKKNSLYLLLKTKEIQEKYFTIDKREDLYYNLTNYYYSCQEWIKVKQYGKKADSIHRNVTHSKTPTYLKLMLCEAYLKSKEKLKFEKLLKDIKNCDEIKLKSPKYMSLYTKLKTHDLINKNNISLATIYIDSASYYKTLYYENAIDNYNKDTKVETQLMQTRFDLTNKNNENIINLSKLKYQKTFITSFIIIIFSLFIIILLQYRYSRIKTQKNKLVKENLTNKNKFLDIVAHELRTPLNAISGIIYLLKNQKNTIEKENLNILEHSVEYLISLSNNIIEYNLQSNNPNITLKNENVNLNNIVQIIVSSFQKNLTENQNIIFNYDTSISENLLIDRLKIIQVLNNIIDNAIKFTEEGEIKVEIKLLENFNDSQLIRFIVEDEGIGVEQSIQSKIYDLFFQGSDEISIKYGGSGIGLTLSKKTLELFNSEIELQSKEKGSIFYFDIKLEKGILDELTINKNETIQLFCDKKVILVVDDNKVNQIIIKKILNTQGYDCIIAENGKDAVEKINLHEYCLVIMDIMMPIMDGFEASIKIHTINPNIPIIALTAISEELNKDKFSQTNILKVLNKPINVDELTYTTSKYCA